MSSRFVYLLVTIFTGTIIANCEDENYFEFDMNSAEVIDPHSFYYDKHSKKMLTDTEDNIDLQISEGSKEQYNVLNSEVKVPSKVENDSSHERIFYKRLIKLLLSNINIEDENDVSVVGIVEIEMSHSQMEVLQNFHIEKTSLREIDEILSSVIKKPQYSHMVKFTNILDILLEKFGMVLKIVQEHPDGAIIIFAMLMVCLTLRMIKWGQGFPMFIIIQIIFVLSFFMTWWQLIKEAEIKNMAEQMKFDTIPVACEPSKMNMWHKFVSFIYSNEDCEKYYQATMSNPKLKITPAFALSHFITTVILHPITHVGTVVSGFIKNATGDLPWMYAWIIQCLLFLCVGIVIIMLPFCLSGASINLGLGPLFRFGIDYHKKDRKGKSIENTREPVQIILQVPHGTNVPALKDEIKNEPLQAHQILPITDSRENRVADEGYIDSVGTDLSSGDTAEIEKYSKNECKRRIKSDESEATKNDGGGDS